VTEAARQAGPCVVLLRAGARPPALWHLIGALRTDVPCAVLPRTASSLEEEALATALRRRGCRIIELADGEARVGAAPVTEGRWLPAQSLLMATGGSAGKPKVVIDTRIRDVGARPRGTRPVSLMNWRPGQRQVVVGALHHAAALTFLAEGLADGNTLLIPGAFAADDVLAAVARWRAEWLQLTPYHLRHLALAMRSGHHNVSSVRGLLHMAAPCPEELKRYWIGQVGADRVFEMYGSTEGIGITVASGREWLRRPGTVGRGFFTRIRILGPDGHPLGPGHEGEVYMRSGRAASDPYLNPADRLGVTADGFATVGDRGRLDADGYLYLAPRQPCRIQVGGETVNPADVEAALMAHPDVADAAVAGLPDERLGESLLAVVVARGPADAATLKAYLRSRLSPHQVPRAVRFASHLPYTEAGKLDRRRLASGSDPNAGEARG
jgi:bile acid-coenzyme A ligase